MDRWPDLVELKEISYEATERANSSASIAENGVIASRFSRRRFVLDIGWLLIVGMMLDIITLTAIYAGGTVVDAQGSFGRGGIASTSRP